MKFHFLVLDDCRAQSCTVITKTTTTTTTKQQQQQSEDEEEEKTTTTKLKSNLNILIRFQIVLLCYVKRWREVCLYVKQLR